MNCRREGDSGGMLGLYAAMGCLLGGWELG
jgi:hypothetical protein